MSPQFGQRTLRHQVVVSGTGIHTGSHATVHIHPAAPDTGVVFLNSMETVAASYANVSDTRRSTCLKGQEVSVRTVEHLLSAIAGLTIDNCIIEIEGPEVPILDGSSLPWVELLTDAGIEESKDPPRVIAPAKPVAVHMGSSWLVVVPSESLSITVVTEWAHPLLGLETTHLSVSPDNYAEQIAPARTFGFIEEVQKLLDCGLAKGASLENALVVYPDRFSSPLRLPMECNRHKALDLIGDLALAGGRIHGSVTAVLPSHKANVEMAAALARQSEETHG